MAILIIALYGLFGLISLGISAYAWQRRDRVRGAGYFALAILAEALWTFGYILETVSPTLNGKIFWDNAQFIGYLFAPALFMLFVLTYLEYEEEKIKPWRWPLLGFSTLLLLIVFTNPLHGFVRYDAVLLDRGASVFLDYSVTTYLYVSAIYSYVLSFAMLYFLMGASWQARHTRWQPLMIIVVGLLFPMIAGTFTMAGISFWGERDIMPLAFSISNIFWAWGVLGYGLLDVVPIAHRKIFTNNEDMIIILDLEQQIIDLNPQARRLITDETNPIGHPFGEIFPEWQALSERKTSYPQQKFIIPTHVWGRVRHCQLIFSDLSDSTGIRAGTMVTVRDMTEIIVTQQELEERTRNMQLMLDVSRKITTILDLDELLPEIVRLTQQSFQFYHVLLFLYDDAERTLNYVTDAGLGNPQIPPDFKMSIDAEIGLIAQAARTHEPIIATIENHNEKSYQVAGLEAAQAELVVPMLHGSQLIGVIILAATDISRFMASDIVLLENLSEQIAIAVSNGRVVQRLQTLQRETALLYEIGQDLNAVSDFDGIVQTLKTHLQADDFTIRLGLNDTFDHLTAAYLREVAYSTIEGYDLQARCFPAGLLPDIEPRSTLSFPSLEDNTIPYVREEMAQEGMNALLLTSLQVQGRRLGVLYYVSPIVNRFTESDQRVLEGLTETVAATVERIRLFDEQVDIAEQLRTIDDTKSQFLASMSHELRTPLNAILNFTKIILMEKIGPLADRQRDLLQKSLNSGEHLLALINDVLDITKIEANMLELYVERDIDLQAEIDATIAAVEPLLDGKPDVVLLMDVDAQLPAITADRRRLRQIMMNLLSNAAKFTERGSITFSVKARSNGTILLAVIDTGPGIAPEQQTLIFDPFVQTDAGKRHMSGTGLGLPISRRLVEAHGGQLWLESEPDDGAAFFVTLPVENEALIYERQEHAQ